MLNSATQCLNLHHQSRQVLHFTASEAQETILERQQNKQDDDTDTDEETPEVSFSPGNSKSSKPSDTKVNSAKSVCTTTPKVQFISDLIVSSNIEKQDSLKLYDDLVMERATASTFIKMDSKV